MISFILNNRVHSIENIDPCTTVLSYLRKYLRKTGTKEGCASGDCGACTVVIGEILGETVRHRAVNSCITLLGSIHGKQLVTIEDLGDPDELHPVQLAMVRKHGSQCGFCTPGFVMSMYALWKNKSSPDRSDIVEALAGNLCRCTGYRPIIEAAESMNRSDTGVSTADNVAELLDMFHSISEERFASLANGPRQYLAPNTLGELSEVLQMYPEAHLVSGGTDLCLEITQGLKDLDIVVYLGNVDQLTNIREFSDSYLIGAAVRYADVYDLLASESVDLGEMLERLGSMQIRNVGTLGGNIANASPIADMPPALIAIGADLHLRRDETTRVIPLEDFYSGYKATILEPGEFIQYIDIPKIRSDHIFKMFKVSKRLDDDISAVCGAFYFKLEGTRVAECRIAYGGMAAIPKRAIRCERTLIGGDWSDETIERGIQALRMDFQPISDARASAEYRMTVCENLLQKCFLETRDPELLSRVVRYA